MTVPTIYVDNLPYHVPEGANLLQACLGLGFDLHTALGSLVVLASRRTAPLATSSRAGPGSHELEF